VANGATGTTAIENGPSYAANTNLEQISDWLTKILVGVGLTQLPGIRKAFTEMVQFLGPAFGGRVYSPIFASVLVMYFLTCGFVLGYLWSRIVLPAQFQQADLAGFQRRLEKAEQATADVAKTVQEQALTDAQVLATVSSLLNPTPGSPSPSQKELNDAVTKASPAIRVQIFNQAQAQRMANWRDRENLPKMERTIPVFRALIAADQERKFDRNHAQLGYALKDKEPPEWAEAERELSDAITIRGQTSIKGMYYYEFNRAFCRIMQDPDFRQGKKSNAESLNRILDDLRAVARIGLTAIIRGDPDVQRFLTTNELSMTDLEKPA
jgi:hypothetical protein